MSNVQPGDRAWVVNCETPFTAWTISRVVQVDSRCTCEGAKHRGRGGPVWFLTEMLTEGRIGVSCLPDWCLKRIPPDGDELPTTQQPLEEFA